MRFHYKLSCKPTYKARLEPRTTTPNSPYLMPFLKPHIDHLERELVDVNVPFPLVLPAAKTVPHKFEHISNMQIHARKLRLEPIKLYIDRITGLAAVKVSITIVDDIGCEAYGNVAVWTNDG